MCTRATKCVREVRRVNITIYAVIDVASVYGAKIPITTTRSRYGTVITRPTKKKNKKYIIQNNDFDSSLTVL